MFDITVISHGGEEFVVHATGCADIQRASKHARATGRPYDLQVASKIELVDIEFGDILADNEYGETAENYLPYIHFAHCANHIPTNS